MAGAAAHCEADLVSDTFEHGLLECAAAYDAGFDSLNFAEHHYSPKQLTPNPHRLRRGRRSFPGAQIGVFGTDLPLNNPVRIAEEYSMLDNLLDGRLRIGMLRGTPNEYLTYGSNPWESATPTRKGSSCSRRASPNPSRSVGKVATTASATSPCGLGTSRIHIRRSSSPATARTARPSPVATGSISGSRTWLPTSVRACHGVP